MAPERGTMLYLLDDEAALGCQAISKGTVRQCNAAGLIVSNGVRWCPTHYGMLCAGWTFFATCKDDSRDWYRQGGA